MATGRQRYWVGFDLGGTKMRVAVYDAAFHVLARAEGKTKGLGSSRMGVVRIAKLIDEAVQAARIKRPDLRLTGIGLAVPGPVNPRTGVIRELPNIGWRNVPVAKLLEKETGVPVAVLNDVDAGTYGEAVFGAGKGGRCVVGVFPGTGIGGGCVLEGRILTGADSSCLEIGHFPVQPDGPLCGCGQRGCLEAVASRLAIAQAVAAAAFRGEAPYVLAVAGTDLREIRSRTLAKAIDAGDGVVERIVREAARQTGVGVAALVNLLAPDKVVLGGGLVEALPKLYLEEVDAAARARVMRTYRDAFKTVIAQLGDDAVITGAAAWAAEQEKR